MLNRNSVKKNKKIALYDLLDKSLDRSMILNDLLFQLVIEKDVKEKLKIQRKIDGFMNDLLLVSRKELVTLYDILEK